MIIKNARIYTPEHTFKTGDLTIRDGRIAFGAPPLEGEEVLDANGAYALPGLVDIHFHGAVGHDFCDADEAGLQAIADFEASKGVLAICPATMTYPEEILNKVMDAAAAHKNGKGADLVGINMEGPFISPKKVGAQNPEYVQGADAAMFRRLQKRAGGLIKLVDVAPEEPCSRRSKLRRYGMGEICAKMADFSILTEDNNRFEKVEDIIADIREGMNKGNPDAKFVEIPDRLDALHYAVDHAQEGDLIAVIGKGHETYRDREGVKTQIGRAHV